MTGPTPGSGRGKERGGAGRGAAELPGACASWEEAPACSRAQPVASTPVHMTAPITRASAFLTVISISDSVGGLFIARPLPEPGCAAASRSPPDGAAGTRTAVAEDSGRQ